MIPEIFQIGNVPINSFGLMVALAFIAAMSCLARSFERAGLPSQYAERYVLAAGVSGLLGARLWYLGENASALRGHLWEALWSSAGFTFYGGFLAAAIVITVMVWRDRLPFNRFVDALGPALALGYGIGRVGCQLSGDGCYGRVTQSILGMSYSTGVIPTPPGILVLPTPLYESLAAVAIALLLTKLEVHPNWLAPYRRFGMYLVLMATERFSIEFLRRNPLICCGLSEAQLLALLMALIGSALLLYSFRAHQRC